MTQLLCAECGEEFVDAEDRHCADCNLWYHASCHAEKHAPSEQIPSPTLGDYARHFWRHKKGDG